MKLGIFISGSGTNMLSIVDNFLQGSFPAISEIPFVLSDKKDAPGLAKAAKRNINTIAVPRKKGESREEHEKRILEAIAPYDTDIIALAGFMRVLSPLFIHTYRGKIINIHPSLLPSFPGVDAQKQAFDHGVKISGCTVHFVDESLDGGPIILQKAVERHPDDTCESFKNRILSQEHILFSQAINIVSQKLFRQDEQYIEIINQQGVNSDEI